MTVRLAEESAERSSERKTDRCRLFLIRRGTTTMKSDARPRMIEALRSMGSRHAGETVAAVTHAVMIRLVVAQLHGTQDESWRIPVGRGSLTEFHIQDRSIRLTSLPQGTDVD